MEKKKDVVYLIGDFRKATVFVGEGFIFSTAEDPKSFEKPVHDVELRGKTYRFWNAEPRFYPDLQKRENTHVYSGDLNGVLLQIDNKGGIFSTHVPELER